MSYALYDPDALQRLSAGQSLRNKTSFSLPFFADGAVAVAHPLWQSLDAVLRLGAHVSTIAFDDLFLTTTLGLRYNLQ